MMTTREALAHAMALLQREGVRSVIASESFQSAGGLVTRTISAFVAEGDRPADEKMVTVISSTWWPATADGRPCPEWEQLLERAAIEGPRLIQEALDVIEATRRVRAERAAVAS